MKNSINTITLAALVAGFSLAMSVGTASAQFSNPRVVVEGRVLSQSGKPVAANVVVRTVNEKAVEQNQHSNSATGSYLALLEPGKKYWMHVEAENIVTKDTLIEAPAHFARITLDFSVVATESTTVSTTATPVAIVPNVVLVENAKQN